MLQPWVGYPIPCRDPPAVNLSSFEATAGALDSPEPTCKDTHTRSRRGPYGLGPVGVAERLFEVIKGMEGRELMHMALIQQLQLATGTEGNDTTCPRGGGGAGGDVTLAADSCHQRQQTGNEQQQPQHSAHCEPVSHTNQKLERGKKRVF